MLKKILVFFIILISMVNFSFGQSETILKSSVKEIKKKKRKKRRAENRKTINYEANTLWNALRPVLGANIFYKDGKAIINTGTLFATGNNFVLWVVNGVILGDQIPNNINIYDIDEVKVLRTPFETEKYGFRGSSGVIEIILKN